MIRALVTTSIHIPFLLREYAADFAKHGYDDTYIIVAGDLKTPPAARELVESLPHGIYLGLDEQTQFLDSLAPAYGALLPWNCIQRRNVALLQAYGLGADLIYTIDDDNLLHTPDYIGHHGRLGQRQDGQRVVEAKDGWLNVCTDAEALGNASFFPRGFSLKQRDYRADAVTYRFSCRVVVNAGMWLGDPDVDAVTRLAIAPCVTRYATMANDSIVLAHGTKCPFNSQNTALHRDVLPAYCLVPGLGRYDDIIASYIVKRIADHMGDYVRFGLPFVYQARNPHDLYKDLQDELIGMQMIDRFVGWLDETVLHGTTYKDCTKELVPVFAKHMNDGDLTVEQMAFMRAIHTHYSHWLELF